MIYASFFKPWIAKQNFKPPFHSKPINSKLTESEVMTILIFFHYSGYRCFKHYYQHCIAKHFKDCFPDLVSYNRFLELLPPMAPYFFGYTNLWAQGTHTQQYYIDSSHLPVCHNKRIDSHKVFKNLATRSKTSMGWFFGLKLPIVVNHLGEIMASTVTTGKKCDHNLALFTQLTQSLPGNLAADKGYIRQKAVEHFLKAGVKLITAARRNMKKYLISCQDFLHLKGGAMIEKVIGWLKNVASIWPTRHRIPVNALVHLWAGVGAYIPADPMRKIENRESQTMLYNCVFTG
ncbi:MAG: IS982 family transposase [Cytophagales bacterium]|nr:IS982 family transposase [Cytophagales bacterium]